MSVTNDEPSSTDASLPPLTTFLATEKSAARKYADSYYGYQVRTPGRPLLRVLRGNFETAQTTRWYQLNQVVTSGVTPRGTPSDFDPECHHLIERVKRELSSDQSEDTGPPDAVLARKAMPMRQAIERAAELAVRIRGTQSLLDGNHRTALLSFIMSLAETSILLKPSFSVYRAYIILSAREHPGNIGNLLNENAMTDVTNALFRYARSRVQPGTPEWPYLDMWAETVRQLPVYDSVIETQYRRLRVKTGVFDGGEEMEDVKEQMEEWKRLEPSIRAHISLAHPKFQPGASK